MPATRTEGQEAGTGAVQGSARFVARGARYALPLILLLALALRLLLWSQPLHQPANDEVEYITVARDLLAGRGWSFYEHYHWLRAPLYNLFLAGSLWLAGGDPASDAAMHRAALPNIALSVATVYLSYRLTLALVGRRRAALMAALLTAILWTLATFASLSMAETLFTFLFTAGLLCLVRWAKDQGPRTKDERTRPQVPSPKPQVSGHLVTWSPGHLVTAWWLVAAGVLFGLATLTRSITLLFLPVVALWLLLGPTKDQGPKTKDQGLSAANDSNPQAPNPKSQAPSPKPGWPLVARRALAPALFLLVAAAVIAPWTIRNYLAYGRIIPVETGLSYNLWAFNEPREEQETIFHVLENIPNPADRSDYATAKGLARLREDPAILARKLWPGWVYLWSVKAIEDRFIQESYYGDVGLPQFVAAFIFDDALGLLIALAGMAGLVLYRREEWPPRGGVWRRALATLRAPKALMVLWVLYAIATTMLTHAETRYRHFLYPILIPYAAWLLTRLRATGQSPAAMPRSPGPPAWRLLGIAAIWALLGGVWLVYYPRSWAAEGASRGWHALASEAAWAAGDRDAALREDERVLAVRKTPDAWLRLGDHARAIGDTRRAEKAYRSAVAIAPPYVAAVARFGDLLRALGNEHDARDAFVGDYVDQQRLVDWSWRNLGSAAAPTVAVGDGLDFGYVGGVYLPELQEGARVRWTNGLGMLRMRGPVGPAVLRLRLAAPRPDGAASVRVCVAGRCQSLDLGPAWRVYSLPVDIMKEAPLLVELRSDTFVAAEGRRLGILIDSASLEPLLP
ncbi:MAG: phospholipid carrier-dependent glycosyltransferase [Kouleothrix sp.]|nr:phospholipid carrier-dependent glycosyltransferase [Kouleothrix sp.]